MVWVGRLLSFVEHNDIYNPCDNLQSKGIYLSNYDYVELINSENNT